mgnify:CR=1 FL=1
MIRRAKMTLIVPLLAGAMPAEAKPLPDKAAIASTAQKAMAATGARGLAIAAAAMALKMAFFPWVLSWLMCDRP